MFASLGAGVARFARTVVCVWILGLITLGTLTAGGLGGEGLFDRLHTGEPRVEGSESLAAAELIDRHRTVGEELTLALTGLDLAGPDPAVMAAFHSRVRAIDGVARVLDPTAPGVSGLASEGALVVQVALEPDLGPAAEGAHDEVVAELERLAGELGATGVVSSGHLMVTEITDQIQRDLVRGEAVAFPVSLLVMVVVFGGFLAAGMPLLGALASIIGGLGSLWAFSFALDLDAVVVNVVTVLGLGLSIDYGLLIVSRYRQELRAAIAGAPDPTSPPHRDLAVAAAISRTVATAGRTVAFSALTVAVSVAGLAVFRLEILRSLGAAGVSVVLIALASALTLVPAVLALLGRRMARPSVIGAVPGLRPLFRRLGDLPPRSGVFSRLATRMQRRPWLAVIGSVAVLVVLASPVLDLQMRNSTTELLPAESTQRQFLDTVNEHFPALAPPALTVVTEAGTAREVAGRIAALPGVAALDPPRELGEGWVRVGVRLDAPDPGGPEAMEVVEEIRALGQARAWVTGQAANQVDFNAALRDGLPWAGAIVVLATLVLLFLMTGSLLVPLKALAINVVSLGASLGITSWIFTEGHLSGLLNFTSAGGLESYVVAVVVAFGFGLAMDYEVFLLARIKELYDAGAPNDAAVRDGLQLSGRIITSAALVIIVVFAGFIAGDLLAIKQVGVALAVTVAIDATLVRMVLVPATMTLLGEWNWWAPRPLRWLHERIGVG